MEVNRHCLQHETFYFFVGFLNAVPVVHVSFHVSPLGCTRFDDIETAEEYRGQGYAREIMHYVTNFCREHQFPLCFQWPANTTSERMSYDAGFRHVFSFPAGSAVYENRMEK